MIILRQSITDILKRWDIEIENKARDFLQADKTAKEVKSFVDEAYKSQCRWRCRNDLYYLCKITGHDKIIDEKWRYYYEPFCDEISLMNWQIVKLGIHPPSEGMLRIEQVTDSPKEDLKFLQRMYLAFRTFWKTSIISKVHSVQLLLNFPNIHIVLCHNAQGNASDNLVAIKNMFLTTALRYWFPECIPNTKEWGNMQGFSLANRTDLGRDEHNIEAVGVDTEITGRHWQVAKKNDLVTEKSVTTEEQIKKTMDWDDRFNIGLFDDPQFPLQDYEGTRYHFADLYSKKLSDKRIKFTKIALLNDFEDNSSCVIPERFPPEAIKDLKETDPWTFWCQMMLEPKDPAKMRFSPEMIVYYTEIPQGINYYLLVDPASARKKRSDFTVMKVIGIDSQGKKYIVDGIRDKLDPKQRIDGAIRLAIKWNIKACGWEAIAFQSTDCFYFEERRRKEQLRFTLEEIKSHSVSKEDRIRALMPEYANGKWLWPPKGVLVRNSRFYGRTYDLMEQQEDEFLHFPLCEHDDLLDVDTFLNLMTSIITPQPIEDKHESEGMTFGEYHKIRENRQKALRKNPWQKFYQPSYR